ncbi:MAG: ATP-binding cassette domain-containing protein [Bacilli bacterium]|jgi:ABC-2 type transport system ATP-binding protein|nr:ATP-binding cassette domain-containing protein [Bacilli bacterium]
MKIEIKDVTKKFKKDTILKNVNMSLSAGNIYGFIGRNGSGKSVLLKLICSFYEPTSGKILFDGKDIFASAEFPPRTRALIEKPNFLPDLTGKENLMLLANIQHLITETEVDEILEKVLLSDDKHKKYHKYSLGMKQKLGIAQVLMEHPEVIILDEPFNGLDDDSIKQIRTLLLEEKKKGKLIIIATHLKDDIQFLCDEVYEFQNGVVFKK